MRRSSNEKNRSGAFFGRFLREVFGATGFFVLFFLYLWLRIQPAIELHASGPLFFWSHSFSTRFFNRPGGPLDYAAAFLAQFSYYDWLGALVFSALACLLFLGTRSMLRRVSGRAPGKVLFVLPFLLLVSLDLYDGLSLNILLGSLLAVAAAVAWLLCPSSRPGLRLTICWAAAVALFYLGGLWSCLLFVVIAALGEILQRRSWRLALGYGLPALLGSVCMLHLGGPVSARWLNPWGVGPSLVVAALVYLFFPITALLLALAAPSPVASQSPPLKRRTSSPAALPARWFHVRGLRHASTVGLFLAGGASVWLVFEDQRKVRAQIDFYAWRGDYQQILALAPRLKLMDTSSEIRVQWALYEAGRLSQDLFSFPIQVPHNVLPGLNSGVPACRAQVEPLLELGLINDAEHYAHEALEWEDNRPDLLLMLAKVNVLQGRPEAARVFLNVLLQVPFRDGEARDYLRQLDADPRLTGDKGLSQIRSRLLAQDFAHGGMVDASFLYGELLRANHLNRMAFEYMIAQDLLSLDLDKLMAELWRLDDLGYAAIPRHYEEAILLYQKRNQTQVELRGRQIHHETIARFQQLSAAMERQVYDTSPGRQAMARDFGDTFWYYYLKEMATRRPDN